MKTKIETATALIDKENSKDPNTTVFESVVHPKELLYSKRMTHQLLSIDPNASETLQVAIRAQHICRWKIDRKQYSMDRVGYFQWRNDLKKMHSDLTSSILVKVGYNDTFIDRVSFLINKKRLKKDNETQLLEDVACLVFLNYYFDDFITKHTNEKIIDIIQKTWKKMSPKGHELALQLKLSQKGLKLVKKAIFQTQ